MTDRKFKKGDIIVQKSEPNRIIVLDKNQQFKVVKLIKDRNGNEWVIAVIFISDLLTDDEQSFWTFHIDTIKLDKKHYLMRELAAALWEEN